MTDLKVLKRDLKESNEMLRSKGLVPAVMYGPEFESTPIMVDDIEFRKVYRQTGKSSIINTVGEIKGEMVIVQDVSVHVVSGELLHIDFKVTEKGKKTEVTIPFKLIGESPAVKNNLGILNFSNDEVVIEAIPSLIPSHIDVDISTLVALGDGIKLSDITFPKGVDILEEVDLTIVSITAIREEEEEVVESEEFSEPELVNQKGKEESEAPEEK